MVAPVLEQIAEEQAGKIKIAKLDYDANPETPNKYGVWAAALLLYKDGEVVEQIVGAKPKRALLQVIEPHL